MLCFLDDRVRIVLRDVCTDGHRPGDVVVTHFFENMCPCRVPKHWPRASLGVGFPLKLKGFSTSENICWSS